MSGVKVRPSISEPGRYVIDLPPFDVIDVAREELVAIVEAGSRLLADEVHAERSHRAPDLSDDELDVIRRFGIHDPEIMAALEHDAVLERELSDSGSGR